MTPPHRYHGLRLESGWGLMDSLHSGLVLLSNVEAPMRFFMRDPDRPERYLLYRSWNDYTLQPIGEPFGWCLESDFQGRA